MSLTRDETLAAARCALRYPAGCGFSFFSVDYEPNPGCAAMLLALRKASAEYG
jgi:hypothetical protein